MVGIDSNGTNFDSGVSRLMPGSDPGESIPSIGSGAADVQLRKGNECKAG